MGVTNHQVTEGEINGMQWLLEHKNETIITYSIYNELQRFNDVILGENESEKTRWNRFKPVPALFNFTQNDYFVAVSSYSIERFTKYWPDNIKYPKNLFDDLSSKKDLHAVFQSSSISIYKN
jgi:hypothetical protein